MSKGTDIMTSTKRASVCLSIVVGGVVVIYGERRRFRYDDTLNSDKPLPRSVSLSFDVLSQASQRVELGE